MGAAPRGGSRGLLEEPWPRPGTGHQLGTGQPLDMGAEIRGGGAAGLQGNSWGFGGTLLPALFPDTPPRPPQRFSNHLIPNMVTSGVDSVCV